MSKEGPKSEVQGRSSPGGPSAGKTILRKSEGPPSLARYRARTAPQTWYESQSATDMVAEVASGHGPPEETRKKMASESDAVAASRWRSEEYTVRRQVVEEVLKALKVQPKLDAFALKDNARCSRFWGPNSPEVKDAFAVKWDANQLMWANPPFSMLQAVLDKVRRDEGHLVLCAPSWEDKYWYKSLEDMSVATAKVEAGQPIFLFRGQDIGSTRWPVVFVLLCGHRRRCSWDEMVWRSLSRAQKRKSRRRRVWQRFQEGDGGEQ